MGTKTDDATRAKLHEEAASLSLLESPLQHRHLHDWIREHVPREPDYVAVDVGDHEGELACVVAPDVREVTIIDSNRAELAAAERRVDAEGLANVVFKPGELSALPFADASFDLVLCGLPLDRIDDPEALVTELARVCRQGGTILVIAAALPRPAAGPQEAEATARAAPAPPVGRLAGLLERAGTTVVHRSEHDESPEIAARLRQIGTARSFAERMRLHFTVQWTAVVAEKHGDELPPAGLA